MNLNDFEPPFSSCPEWDSDDTAAMKAYIISKLKEFGEKLKKEIKTEVESEGKLNLNQAICYAYDKGYNFRNSELNRRIAEELKELE